MDSPAPFLDVPHLIEASQPRQRGGWFWYAVGIFLLVVFASAYVSAQSKKLALLVDVFSQLVLIGMIVALAYGKALVARRRRDEMRQVEALEELIQLRRWSEAAGTAEQFLSKPTLTPQARAQALIFLSSILARYGRFEDAIAVHQHLIDTINFDDGTAHGIRLGRAMAMLREDHLVDADSAMNELRRMSQGRESAGLALIQLYRDVKTGHPTEAIEHFDQYLPAFRQQLGHRTGDAYALLAKAYDLLGRTDEARVAYEKATLLTPVMELNRRFPEVVSLASKYPVTATPPELAGVAA
jgi:tetratricopeptide (TPR) repeat protein